MASVDQEHNKNKATRKQTANKVANVCVVYQIFRKLININTQLPVTDLCVRVCGSVRMKIVHLVSWHGLDATLLQYGRSQRLNHKGHIKHFNRKKLGIPLYYYFILLYYYYAWDRAMLMIMFDM